MMEVSSYDGKSFSLSRFILLVKVPPHDNGFSSRNRKVSLELPKASRGMWRDGVVAKGVWWRGGGVVVAREGCVEGENAGGN